MKKKTLLISLLAGVVTIGTIAIAGPHHKMKRGGYYGEEMRAPSAERVMKRLSKLDLSDGQTAEIRGLVESGLESTKAQRESLKALHHQMKALMLAEAVDETAIKSTSLEIANLKSDLLIARLNHRNQIAALLNDDQKAKMEKMKQRRKNKRRDN